MTTPRHLLAGLAIIGAATALAACGSSSKSGNSGSASLALSITDSGKGASFSGPASTKGGLVRLSLKNTGKSPHSVQLVLVQGGHTTTQAYQLLSGNNNTTPSWLRGAGGVSTTLPGQTNTATVNLAPGHYLVTEIGGPGGGPPPARADLTVAAGSAGQLPSAPATVAALAPAKDKYKWQISGLHSGHNVLTFKSQGAKALHLIAAVRLKPGQNPSLATIQKSFSSQGPPPYADLSSYQSTAVLDGGKSQVATLDLKPGTYVFLCPLPDRDGGKPHAVEGLLTKLTVK